MALSALAKRIPYVATTYDRGQGKHQIETVIPGQACSRVLEELLLRFDYGVRVGRAPPPSDSPSVGETNPRHAGAATWELRLINGERLMNGEFLGGTWQDAVARGDNRIVPTMNAFGKRWNGGMGVGK